MEQHPPKSGSVHSDAQSWIRSEWFGMVGGFTPVPVEELPADEPAQERSAVSFSVDIGKSAHIDREERAER